MSDQLIWGMYDRVSKTLDRKASEVEIGLERFNADRFKRLYGVFRMDHLAGRIVELNPDKAELPTGSILHLLDDVTNEEHSDVPNTDNIFLKNESFRKYIYHIREPQLEGPVSIADKYIYRPAGLPSVLMHFRSEQGSNFRYCNTLEELPTKNEALIVVNHNPLFRITLFGRLQYFRKIQIILASILNTAWKLTDLNKKQYILIPWDHNVYKQNEFLRSRDQLTPTTVRHPDNFHYIVMMHIANFLWDTATTSCFKKLSDKQLEQITLILDFNGKYIFYNLADLAALNVKNKAYLRCINQMNSLSILGNPEITEDTKSYFTTDKISAGEETTTDNSAKVYSVKDALDTEDVETTPAEDYEERKEKVVDTAISTISGAAPNNPIGAIKRHYLNAVNAVKDEVATALQPTNPEVTITETPKDAHHFNVHKKVIAKAPINSSHKAETSKQDNHSEEYINLVENEADAFIEKAEHLTPKQKQRAKMLAHKSFEVELGGRKIRDILTQDTDVSIEDDVLSEDVLGLKLPDKSALRSSIYSFDKSYMQKTNQKHLAGIITSFARNGVFLTGVKEQKVVSELNNYTSYALSYEDIDGKKSTVRFRVPTVDREGRVTIDGIKKVLKKQRITLPIVKISDTEVSLSSNYNKTRVVRVTTKAHSYFDYIDSFVNSKKSNAEVVYGTCVVRDIPLAYEYATIADRYKSVKFTDKDGVNWELFFDYNHRLEHFGQDADTLAKLESNYGTYCGHNDKSYFFIDNFNKVNAVSRQGGEDIENKYTSLELIFRLSLKEGERVTKQLTEWVNCKILDAFLPVMFMLAYRFGLRATLDYLGIKYTITEGRSKIITAESDPQAKYPNLRAGTEGFLDLFKDKRAKLVCPVPFVPRGSEPWHFEFHFTRGDPKSIANKKIDINDYVRDENGNAVTVDAPKFKSLPEFLKWLKTTAVSAVKKHTDSKDNAPIVVVLERKWYDFFKNSKEWFGTGNWNAGYYLDFRYVVNDPVVIDDLLKEKGTEASIVTIDTPSQSRLVTDGGIDVAERRYVVKPGDIAIRFADKVLWFNRYPLKQSLVVAGLDAYDLSNYEMAAFESKDIYYQLLLDKGMSINYLKGIDSFFDLFVDNMTYSVLRRMHEPTNLRDLLLRSVELLTTLDYRPPSSKVNHRIRGYEQFNAIIYNEMSRQLAAYQTRRGRGNLFSVNPEAIYLRIMQNASMVPSESPNPLQDIKEQTYLTYAGVGGRTDESFVVNDRRFAKDDVGVISESTVDNKKVGLNAQLSFDPLIENTEGILGESKDIRPANFLSIYGLMFPFATHDDTKRLKIRAFKLQDL